MTAHGGLAEAENTTEAKSAPLYIVLFHFGPRTFLLLRRAERGAVWEATALWGVPSDLPRGFGLAAQLVGCEVGDLGVSSSAVISVAERALAHCAWKKEALSKYPSRQQARHAR